MMKAIEDVRAMPDEEFMSKYEDLVHHFIWKRYKGMLEIVKANTGLEMEDLVQYGMMGLIKARRDFNHELGYQFSTYAIPKIHGEVGKFIMNSHKIKVPRDLYVLRGKMMRQGLMEEDGETTTKCTSFRSERGITISTQYKVSTGCHVYIGEWWE